MEFSMTGFTQEHGIRRYIFKAASVDQKFREFAVDADVTVARKYGIALQELPLLCRRLLESDAAGQISRMEGDASMQDARVLTFSEELMRQHADRCADLERALQERRRSHRRPNTARLGEHWRGRQ